MHGQSKLQVQVDLLVCVTVLKPMKHATLSMFVLAVSPVLCGAIFANVPCQATAHENVLALPDNTHA